MSRRHLTSSGSGDAGVAPVLLVWLVTLQDAQGRAPPPALLHSCGSEIIQNSHVQRVCSNVRLGLGSPGPHVQRFYFEKTLAHVLLLKYPPRVPSRPSVYEPSHD